MKLWGGRFKKKTDELVEEYTASLPFDRRLYKCDIRGSIVHANMLAKCGIISRDEASKMVNGLREIERDIKEGKFSFDIADEDIHMAIERALIEKIGPIGGKLHTARSRNDQVVTDLRLFLKNEILTVGNLLVGLQQVLLELAEKNIGIIMPGYTHLQRAQPVFFSHHLMAYFFMFQRDFKRLKCCYKWMDSMPLGSGALAGTSFPIDREFVAKELGFYKVGENSLDAVSDRDFVVDFLAVASLLMVHLSRFCEELVLWSTEEFGFIELDEAYTTGSSIMPQKKNPDVAELIRGKSGRVFGHLMGMLTVLKGLPLAYNRDLQEDKEALFDAVDTVKMTLKVFTGMLAFLKPNPKKMKMATERGYLVATDMADYLTGKGLPFREAHEVVGKIVSFCLEKGCSFDQLNLGDYRKFSPQFDEDIFEIVKVENSVESKISQGGTSSNRVREQFGIAAKLIAEEEKWLRAH
ncbi:MAG TPA: argininosuccinate lyase [Actinobacteria bacterium]|nr:argininosuccinate lyase [Actinomycetota bacterium]